MRLTFLLLAVSLTTSCIHAQDNTNTTDKEAAYTKTINSRADKIVATLNISDPQKANRVKTLIANHYRNLNTVYTVRDEQIKSAKAAFTTNKDVLAAKTKEIEEATSKNIRSVHNDFIKKLSAELSEDQIVKVKDGLTYGVLPLTYKAYLDMLPKLTAEQKEQIMKWLVEAREYAMDAESSDKKHWWFGKYKGRINNYLSAAGYNMKKEGEEWQKRIKEREASKNGTKTN